MSTGFSSSLSGQVAVVTGASGGIGRAIAFELARRGASVALHGNRGRKAADELAAQFRELGGDASVHNADLASESECGALGEKAWQWKSGVDIWANVAGAD